MNDLISTPCHEPELADVRHYLEHSLSDNTRRAYRTDLAHYRAWGGLIPADPALIASYLSAHAEALAIATLQRRLVSIGKAHTVAGHSDPTKTELVRLTMRGIRRLHGKPQSQVSPLMRDDLIAVLNHIPDTSKGQRDRALLLLGFCCALRRSELVAVKVQDIEFNNQGLVLTLRRSKTDQAGVGRKIAVPFGRGGRVCPVRSVRSWLKISSIENGAVFRSIRKGGAISENPLSDKAVADIIKKYTAKAGLDPRQYSGHSLRAGLCSSAAQQGISSWVIRKQSGHAGDAMLNRYIRIGDLFTHNAAALF